ncbi:GDP-D-glucose phosphorylase 1 [Bombina bombina]|uniref:GDP-D-glucose phosphorylase 1 n=1 Tax=Bombina bombina TaxID=8345 RepID=UPI00235B0B51|nr:GDP-D-glucose phosphorylase 1 [Bombina bombina]XP_053573668.1 GDP-D-glucose phosphorylase 1 [Bombina bombina]XP_053573669.1 GDP-D-glucose phosphorylase 1 [Bombina bombina]XP_053573670.1 GDP-D-glucose phosphorylase 1 [Bombina bombina]XP_053573671.1 GDP-D-glucose phosphorylase 1 [Bombina bombina]XP_053573672.1 GDP-D-glucose phosphorylase 1 [Bombina bombina]XP_053573673.1 GDP-D-glucose phosphorylase 1 [Bombina bombina]
MEEKHILSVNEAEIEEYIYSEEDFVIPSRAWQEINEHADVDKPFLSIFDTLLQSKWVEKMKQGLFRYSLWKLETKILPGNIKYVAQLNIQRGLDRRKPEDIQSIQQQYNPKQFNFNKIKPEEAIFHLFRSPCKNGFQVNTKCVDQGPLTSKSTPSGICRSSSILVVINVSPLEFGHVLLIPHPSLCLPQILTEDLMRFGLESILLSAHPGFRVGFNSLGGFASVNHLHLHGFYLNQELLIESSESKPLCPKINFHQLTNFPAPGFLFYTNGKDLHSVAQRVCKVTNYFVAKNIAHNVFATRGREPGNIGSSECREGIRVIIWARKSCFGAKEESAFNVALCELAGHLPFKNQEDFNSITEDDVIGIIKKYLLPDNEFVQLSSDLIAHITNGL